MIPFIIIMSVVVLILLIIIISNIKIVKQTEKIIVERLGAYRTTWGVGIHMLLPFFDRIALRVSMKEQVKDFEPQSVITKDNVTMQIDTVVFFVVTDAKLFAYGVENPIAGLQNLSATTLRNIIGDMELDQTLTSRETINARMQATLDEATDPWGMKVTRVEIKNIQPPKEIEEVMTKQMRAERERRQVVLEAQAHQEAVVSRAEGDKKAKILAAEAERDAQIALAEGKSKSIRMVYEAEAEGLEAIKNAKADESVIRLKTLDALKDVADGRATKIFLPSDVTNVLSSAGAIGEAMGIGDALPVDRSAPKPPAKPTDPCLSEESSKGTLNAAQTNEAINADVEKSYHEED